MDYDWGMCRIFSPQILLDGDDYPTRIEKSRAAPCLHPAYGEQFANRLQKGSHAKPRSRKEEKTQTENIRRSSGMNHVNLVEIDLLRGGQRMPMLDPWPDSPHTLLIARAGSQLCRVWRAHNRRSLSVIPVPLAKQDSDIPLDLQPMIDEIYQRFRYPRSIDYTKPLTPPLDAAETGWLKQQLHVRRDRR
jgi:Protein of unknown function (DUF4058)